MVKVLRFVGDHLDEELPLHRLAAVAGFSPYHFHRQFRAFTGMTVTRFVSLLRLKRASYQLAFELDQQIIAIAYEAGFANPESFSRAFKHTVGQSPSDFRRDPGWEQWRQKLQMTTQQVLASGFFADGQSNWKGQTVMKVNIIDFKAIPVAVLEHHGSPSTLMASVARFIEWRKSCDDSPVASCRTFGVAYNDPDQVVSDDFHFDVCGELAKPLSPNDYGVVSKVIPGGRCAVVRHRGSTDVLGITVHALYRDWVPVSGEELRDFPCFFHYIDRLPQVSEQEQITDVYLPIK